MPVLGLIHDPPKVETRKIYSLYYSPSQTEEYRRQIALGLPRKKISMVAYELPESFSWREKMSPVKDQGDTGSCASMAATAIIEFLYPGIPDYSEAWLYEVTNNICFCFRCDKVYNQEDFLVNGAPKCGDIKCSVCGEPLERVCDCGRYFYMVMDQLSKLGEPPEECRRYYGVCSGKPPETYGAGSPDWCSDWKPEAKGQRIAFETPEITLGNLKHAIYQAPVCIGMKVYENFYTYSGDIYDKEEGAYTGGHAVTLVGWNDTDRYFILRNSWGRIWGIDGYCKYSYDLVKSLFNAYLLKKVVPKYICDILVVK